MRTRIPTSSAQSAEAAALVTAIVVLALAVADQAMGQPSVAAAPFWHFTVTGAAADGNNFTQVSAACGRTLHHIVFMEPDIGLPVCCRANACGCR